MSRTCSNKMACPGKRTPLRSGCRAARAVVVGGEKEIISVLQQGAVRSELTSNRSMHCAQLKRRLSLRRLFLLSVSLLEPCWGPSFAAGASLDYICKRQRVKSVDLKRPERKRQYDSKNWRRGRIFQTISRAEEGVHGEGNGCFSCTFI